MAAYAQSAAWDLESLEPRPERPKHPAVSLIFLTSLGLFIVWSILGFFVTASAMVWLIVLTGWLISLAFHEYGHAATAFHAGDTTVAGYLSLNFLLYMDPIMSILIPVLLLVLGGMPLPGGSVVVSTSRLRSTTWESCVSLAGPLANVVFGFALRSVMFLIEVADSSGTIMHGGSTGRGWTVLIYLQGLSAFLNLLPLPPLDGWGVISPWLSPSCFVKRWLSQSSWNGRTASLLSFTVIYVLLSLTPLLDWFSTPITAMYQLDSALMATGFAAFFGALTFAS